MYLIENFDSIQGRKRLQGRCSLVQRKILITGSKGLIGKSLKKSLCALGFKVLGVDNAYDTQHEEYGDIRDIELLGSLARGAVGIVHLAGVSRVITGERNPELCRLLNVEATQNILELAKNLPNKPWVIYASSREVYGQQDNLFIKEDAPLLPLNAYARSKAAAEQSVMDYRKKGLQTAILRFSNVYGSTSDHPDRVVPAFCRIAATGGSMRIDGGHNIFDFTHIDDVTVGIVKVIERLQAGCFDLPTLHFVTGQGTSLLQAAELAKNASGKTVEFLHTPSRSFDVGSFYGDPTLAKQVLNWQTKITIQRGIARLVQDFKAHLLIA